jgi:RNA polymerase sigma-70 factor (ECF subfamily)
MTRVKLAGPPTAETGFEQVVLPHLDAAYRLARWLLRNDANAQDAVQEGCLRALRYFHTFSGGNGRAWFLRIVRHACWQSRRPDLVGRMDAFDEQRHSSEHETASPEARLMQIDDVALIERALSRLSGRFRELLVLRELEGLSYQELSEVLGIPIGTVMSGLSRSRQALRVALQHEQRSGATPMAGDTEETENHKRSA